MKLCTATLLFSVCLLSGFNAQSSCTITGNTSVCPGAIVTYSTSTSGTNFHWSAVNGNVNSTTGSSATIDWGNTGSGIVQVDITNTNGTITTCSLTVTILATPNTVLLTNFQSECTVFTKRDDGVVIPSLEDAQCWHVCEHSTVYYSVTYHAGSTYTWDVLGNTNWAFDISSHNEIEVHWGSYGSSIVTVTETDINGCSTTVSHCITIIGIPHGTITTAPHYTITGTDTTLNLCLYEVANFMGAYDPGASYSPPMNWFWDFGDGAFSIDQNATHSYQLPGDYIVSFTVTNQCGCSQTSYLKVHVTDLVPPNIECPTPVCGGDTASYYTNASCSDYVWSVTNGTILSSPPYGSNIVVAWNNYCQTPGIVTLETPNCANYCSSPVSVVIPILCPNDPIDGPTIVCIGEQVKYIVPNVPGTTYTWTIPGADIVSPQGEHTIEVSWPIAGTYHVRVDYYNQILDCGGSSDITVVVKPKFMITAPAQVCISDCFDLTTSPSGTFTWHVYDASNTLVHTFFNVTGTLHICNWGFGAGTFTFSASSSQYCEAKSVYIKILPSPSAPGPPTGDLWVCPNTPHVYNAPSGSSGTYFEWTVTNGTPSVANGNQVTITWGSSGPYSISLVQIDMIHGCRSPASTLTVNQIVAVTPTLANYDNTQCVNGIVTYTISNFSSLHADNITWSIDNPVTAGSVISTSADHSQATIQWNNSVQTGVHIILTIKTCNYSNTITSFPLDLVAVPPITIVENPNPSCEGSPVSFSVTGLGSGTYSYNWNFGGGNTSTLANPSHSFILNNTTNTYPVSVTVTDAVQSCTSVATSNVQVIPGPGADIIVYGANCPNLELEAAQSPPLNFEWAMDPNHTVIGTSNYVQISTQGTYYLTVTDPTTGCSSSASVPISCIPPSNCTHDPHLLDVSFNDPQPQCPTVTFQANITGTYTTISWNFGDGSSSNVQNPTHTYSSSGRFTVCVSVIDNSTNICAAFCLDIIVPLYPDFSWSISCNTSTSCSNCYDVLLTDHSNAYYGVGQWTWKEGNTVLATGQAPSPIHLSAGSHSITLEITDGMSTCSKTYSITIPTPPSPSFTVSAGPYCENITNVTFNYSGTGQSNISSAFWDFGDNSYSALFTQTTRVYTGSNLTPIPSLVVTDKYGCNYSYTGSSLAISHNTIGFVYSPPNQTICPGTTGSILATPNPGSSYTWLWSNGSTSNPIFPNHTGTYYATAYESSTGCYLKNLPGVNVTEKNVPVPVISGDISYCQDESVLLNANQGSSFNYVWHATKNGSTFTGFIATGPSFSIPFATAGVYVVQVQISSPTNPQCPRSTSVTVTVNTDPPFPNIVSNINPPCEGQQLILSVTNAGSNYINWSTGDNWSPIYVYQAGDYAATYTDANGCTSSSDFIVDAIPDFSFLFTGCLEFCDTAHVTIPGDPYHAYSDWQWIVTYMGNPSVVSSGTSSPVTDLVLGTLQPGYYEITLQVTTIDGCTTISDPIQLTITRCNCEFFEPKPTVKFYCLFEDANGIRHYGIEVTFNSNIVDQCTSSNTVLLLTSPDGVITMVNNFPSQPMTGIFVPYSSSTLDVCVDFDLTNSNPDFNQCNCIASWCGKLPEIPCPYETPCNFDMDILEIHCLGNGPSNYGFTLSITVSSNYTVWFSTPNGTLTGMPSTISSGVTIINGQAFLSPNTHYLCIQINAYDSITGRFCTQTVCSISPLTDCMPDRKSGISLEQTKATSISLIPNPASEYVDVNYGLTSKNGQLVMVNMSGLLVRSYSLENYSGSIRVSTADIEPGIYFVKLTGTNGECNQQKLVIIK